MKRTQLCVASVLLAAVSTVVGAAPTDYVLHDFALDSGANAPAEGHFTYDPSSGFSAFEVSWRGATFDLTYAANHPYIVTDGGATTAQGTHADSFAVLTKTFPGPGDDASWFAGTVYGDEGGSSFLGFRTDPNDERFVGFDQYRPVVGPRVSNLSTGDWSVTPVPEAGVVAMAAMGLLALAGLRHAGRRAW
ncbi:MAG: hypothetical protein QM742_06695 [Aquabacterium sp.]